jgi:TPR repeat protein/serine/threonine protein kinase
MSDGRAQHPSPQQLADLGKLPAAERAAVNMHLASCPDCRRKLGGVPTGPYQAPPAENLSLSPSILPQPAVAPAAGEVPEELLRSGKFEILGKLGQGGMGAVYKARHTFLNELVAIKVLHAGKVGSPDARARFLREMRAVGQLSHPNIVRALDAAQMGDVLVLVMEFVAGISLDKLVAQRGQLPVDFACRCIVQAASGLQHAHEKGLVHRDVKPANLIVTPREKEVKLLDFGLARVPQGQGKGNQTRFQAFLGTPAFVAPEQAGDARGADIRADVYSLGCTLYYLLAGRPPFQKGSLMDTLIAHAQEEAQPLTELRGDVPAGLCTVVARMLAKKPADRYQTPAEVAEALQPFTVELAKPEPPPPPPPRAPDAVTRTPPPVRAARPPQEMLPPLPAPRRRAAVRVQKRRPVLLWAVAGIATAALLAAGLGAWSALSPREPEPRAEAREEKPVRKAPPEQSKKPPVPPAPVPVEVKKPPSPPAPVPADGFVVLFNGKDLSGWKTHPQQPGQWRVVDGAITCTGTHKAHLFSERGDYKDFHLRVEARVNAEGNSGVFIRAPFGLSLPGPFLHLPHLSGYEAEIMGKQTGSLVVWPSGGGPRVPNSAVRTEGGFLLEVIARGSRVVVQIDGKTTADWTDPARQYRSGHIALQQINPGTVVAFRRVEIKDLSAETASEAEKLFRLAYEHQYGKGRKIDLAAAARLYRQALDSGHPLAAAALGISTFEGAGVARDQAQGRKLCEEGAVTVGRAAASGDPVAQDLFGDMHVYGLGVAKDERAATVWYRRAAEQGNAAAQKDLGNSYASGRGEVRNDEEAVKWYRLAADQGDAWGQNSLAAMLAAGRGVKRNDEEAFQRYRQAAEQGLPAAQTNLAAAYQNGRGVEKNVKDAFHWYELAAQGGHSCAKGQLGWMYAKGLGVARDDQKALRWAREAANGCACGQNMLGVFWSEGIAVKQDPQQAATWFRRAADQGYPTAQDNLGWLYLNGRGVKQDLAEAQRLFRLAAAKNLASGQFHLGWMYDKELGVPRNVAEARKWYQLAANQGHAEARKQLAGLR